MTKKYDYIIIGSGFGGAVSALRLSEKGYKVLVIEKGKWYKAKDFAKTNWDLKKWLWIPFLRFFGIMKISIFRHLFVLSGTGVGGGSLVYANTLPIPKTPFFTTGNWKNLANWETELKPYYQTALQMLGATKNPQLFDGDFQLQQLAKEMNMEDKFEHTNVSVYFGKKGVTAKDPYFNGEGPDRSGCTFCGACMTGCKENAKNSLDKNYLYLAQKNGATILAEQEVYNVVPIDKKDGAKGYQVFTKSSTAIFKQQQIFNAKGVVFSGGVLGTIKLLLKIKKKSLPNISSTLGKNIRSNNETLISVSKLEKNSNVSKGIAIGCVLHTDENTHIEAVRYGAGSGFWKTVHLPFTTGSNVFIRLFKMVVSFVRTPFSYFKIYVVNSWSKNNIVLLFMQTVDSTLSLKRGFFGMMKSSVSSGTKPSPFIPASISLAKKYAKITKGKEMSFALETLFGIPSTAHILGGAVMGIDTSNGVIDKDNKVFGYQNMYIIDGAMISANIGVNPSLTITAIAERAMHQISEK